MKTSRVTLMAYGLTIGGILIVAAIFVFLFVPTLRDVRATADKIEHATAELDAQYANRKKLLTSVSDVKRVRETIQSLSSQFVPPGQELSFITAIEGIAASYGVTEHMSLAPLETSPAPEIRTGFNLSLGGPFTQVMKALVDIEHMPQIVVFTSASVRPGTSQTGSDTPVLIVLQGAIVTPPKGL